MANLLIRCVTMPKALSDDRRPMGHKGITCQNYAGLTYNKKQILGNKGLQWNGT